MLKLISLALMAVFTCGSGASLPSTSIALPKEASNKTSHSDGLKHDSVDSFLDNEEVIFYKEINDFYGNSFDLYELAPSGYAIYAKNESSTAFLEGSHSSFSPFHDFLDSDLYYLGLGSYYYQEGTSVIDIETGSPLDNIEEITSYSYSLSEDIFLMSDESEIEPYKFVNIDDDTDLGSGSGSSSSGSGSSSGSSSSQTVTYNGFTCIKNYEYFKNLEYFPYNDDNCCAMVAICILLGYLDEFYNGDYIPSSWESEFKDHDGTSQAMLEYLKENCKHTIPVVSWFVTGYPMADKEIADCLEDYLNQISTSLKSLTSLDNRSASEGKKTAPYNFIDEGKPPILTFFSYEHDYPYVTKNRPHTCIAYGYNKSDNTLLVHSGWTNESKTHFGNEVIMSNYSLYSYNLIEYKGY